jgi:hypothetical protein
MKFEAKQIKEVLSSLRADRANWESHWQEVSDLVVPNKNHFTRKNVDGEKKTIQVFDSTAVHSNQLLAGALHGMLTNPSSFWFGLTTGDEALDRKDNVRKYLDKTTKKIHMILNNSNFQTEIHEIYLDLGAIGTAVLYMEKDDEMKIRFSAQHLEKCYVMENNKGIVDTVFRCFKWNYKKCFQEWPDTFPAELASQIVTKPNEMVEIIHAVYPREVFNNKRGPKKYKYASCYYMEHNGDMLELSESGYTTFPYAVPRWSKSSGEIYGRSPGMNSLADTKMINKMMETTIIGAEKTIDPPLMAPDDGFVRTIKLFPRGLNYYRSGSSDRIEPILTNPRIDFGFQVLDDVRNRIRQAFFVDQLQLSQGPQMTATEVMQRTEEKLRLMGPVLGRQHFELLKPLIERVFDILQIQGEFGEPPRELVNKEINVQYTSAIAKVQLASEIVNIQKAIAAMAPIAQFAPESLDIIDPDNTVRLILEKSGAPQDMIRTQDAIDSVRQGRAQAQEEKAAQENELAQSEVARNVAPAAMAISKNVAGAVS